MGAVDLVIQVESPGAVVARLQRIGRASHQVGGTSRGRIVPKFRGDLLEATVVAHRMLDGDVESIRVPEGALDVLAQQIVAMVGVEPWPGPRAREVDPAGGELSRPARDALISVLDMPTGATRPTSRRASASPELGSRDRRPGRSQGSAATQRGLGRTIPDRGTYGVHVGETGPRVGELDEEMVAESRPGETFILGATTWRIEAITRDRVIVSPAPGEPGKMPFWRGEGPGRPIELGRALGAFCRELDARLAGDAGEARAWLAPTIISTCLPPTTCAVTSAKQRAATGAMPTDQAITIERFRDELGDIRVCVADAVRQPRPRAVVAGNSRAGSSTSSAIRSIRSTPTTGSQCGSRTATRCPPTTI